MSALTTTILGAVVTASTVSAQQLPPPNQAPRNKSAATESATATEPNPEADPLFGMVATRGARYLLRNGLDYLNYQQYERALKFLREAEKRDHEAEKRGRGAEKRGNGELNKTEKLALKQGIERAQRGMRDAADAEAPYALSDRSRHRNGFTAAKPDTQVAANTNQGPIPPPRQASRLDQPARLGNEVEDHGEPIRLASADLASPDGVSQSSASPSSTKMKTALSDDRPSSAQPAPQLESPSLPAAPQLSDLKDSNSSLLPNPPGAGDQGSAVAGRVAPQRPAPPSVETRALAQAPQPQQPVAQAAANPVEPITSLPPLDPATEPAAQTQGQAGKVNVAPDVPLEATPSPAPAEIKTPLPAPVATPPSSSGLVPSSGSSSEAGAAPTKPAVIDLERIPLPPLANTSGQSDNSGNLAHKETESTTLTSMPNPAKDAAPAPPAATALLPTTPVDTNDLPPLPPELGNTEALSTATAAVRAQAGSSIPLATIPTAANQPPSQPGMPAAAHTEDESLPPLPTVNESRFAPTTAAAHAEPQPVPTVTAGPDPAAPIPSDAATNFDLPPLPSASTAAPVQTPAPAPVQTRAPATQPDPTSNPNLERKPEAVGLETGVGTAPGSVSTSPASSARRLEGTGFDPFLPNRSAAPSTLRPDLRREVEEIARRQEEELHRQTQNPSQPTPLPRDSGASDLRAQTQLDISRAPSPAEARPIKAIPVPEDWVPLPERSWSPQRKYWAAAATCHLPLYFQDPVLERYGHSVEQFVGPIGRYLTYPVDDPTQSTQRNQIIQPFFSAGLFALQIAAWPYNLIMDPPWEAQYDLGYYRPGDPIPTDTYWLPLHGYGPPLHGSRY
jgi:hypothetical protein